MAATRRNLRSAWLRPNKHKRPKPKKNWALAKKLLNWEDLEESTPPKK